MLTPEPELELEDAVVVVVPELLLGDFFEPHPAASPATARAAVAIRARRKHFCMGDDSFSWGAWVTFTSRI
jgi:hypothetical protein